jgi:AraC-like DNA-binding protein
LPEPIVRARALDGLLLERYDYEPGPAANIATHVHETYQIGLALAPAGEYRYRGATFRVPSRQLVIIHPGEPHAVRDIGPRVARATYLMAYVHPSRLVGDGGTVLPFFTDPVGEERHVRRFVHLFEPSGTRLDQDVRIASLLSELYHRGAHRTSAWAAPDGALSRVRELLHDEPLADTSLAELASVAGLHPHHLVRAFGARYGIPPHRYRRLLRIELAKQRLSRGDPLSDVALATGFYDQSHFGRHFRRVVGTTPGRYRPAEP